MAWRGQGTVCASVSLLDAMSLYGLMAFCVWNQRVLIKSAKCGKKWGQSTDSSTRLCWAALQFLCDALLKRARSGCSWLLGLCLSSFETEVCLLFWLLNSPGRAAELGLAQLLCGSLNPLVGGPSCQQGQPLPWLTLWEGWV